MKAGSAILFILSAFVILPPAPGISCTGCFAFDSKHMLFASSEDGYISTPYIWSVTQTGPYRATLLGFYGSYYGPQGGVNDQGLCFDGFGAPEHELNIPPNLPAFPSNLIEYAMTNLSNVQEVVEYFSTHDRSHLTNGQWMFSDRSGNSVIVEGDTFIYIEGDYQVCTNFYQSNPSLGNYPCWRFSKASTELENADSLSVPLFRSILDSVHFDTGPETQYSYIVDLTNSQLYLYYMHDFVNVFSISLENAFGQFNPPVRMVDLIYSSGLAETDLALLPSKPLMDIYPNPSNSSAHIQVTLSQRETLTLAMYDVNGRLIRTIADQPFQAGVHTLAIRSDDMASGVYFLRLLSKTDISTRRFVLVR